MELLVALEIKKKTISRSMTITQVFTWFCKEQKIMPSIYKFYHTMQPCSYNYKPNGVEVKYLSFDEYIMNNVHVYGFSYLLERLIDEYLCTIRREKTYDEFYNIRKKTEDIFKDIYKKWAYFVRYNIKLSDNSFKLGDVVKINHWGNVHYITITDVNVSNFRIMGNVDSDTLKDLPFSVKFDELMNEDETPMKLNFSIKRNRKVYNGKN